MLLVGISSGRRRKATETAVKAVLGAAGERSELISLSGRLIRPCEACGQCVESNVCVLDDDFLSVVHQLRASDGFVFGAPTHFGNMNAKGQAFWERLCFSNRHRMAFPLRGKPGVMVAVDGGPGTGERVLVGLDRFFRAARIRGVGHVTVPGEHLCFSCERAEDCPVRARCELSTSIEELQKIMVCEDDDSGWDLDAEGLLHNIREEVITSGAMLRRAARQSMNQKRRSEE